MKKQFLLFVTSFCLVFFQIQPKAFSQPCPQKINLVSNGDFANSFTGFTSGLAPSGWNCATDAYGIGTAFDDFCTSFPTTPNGTDMMVVDFSVGGSGTIILQQPLNNVTAGTSYTIGFRGASRNAGVPVPIDVFYDSYFIGTLTITSAHSFANYALNWTAPSGVPANGNFTLRINGSDAWHDFAVTDVEFSHCPPLEWRKTFESGKDHNHFSIVEIDDDYIVAGTLYDRGKLTRTTSLVKRFNEVGTIIWEKEYDMDGAFDARCFDIELGGTNGDILALTGYVQSTSLSSPQTFFMTLDANNGTVMDYQQFALGTFTESTGLNILYSPTQKEYYIAGYQSNDILDPISDKMGYVLSLDNSLNLNWVRRISSPASSSDRNMANNLTEIPGAGIFVTGSVNNDPVSGGYGDISTLKLLLNYSGGTIWDKTTISSNSHECGVDAIYDAGSDMLYILSNNSEAHTFEVEQLTNASTLGMPGISGTNGLNSILNGNDVAGFSLAFDPHSSNLIVAGMISQMSGGSMSNTPSFIAHIDPNSNYNVTSLRYIETNNIGYRDHDHDVFQAFEGQMALINYPDILAVSSSNFVFLGYTELNGYSLSITRTDATGYTQSIKDCEVLTTAEPLESIPVYTAASATNESASSISLQTRTTQPGYTVIPGCTQSQMKNGTDIIQSNALSKSLIVYPNPVSNILQVEVPNSKENTKVNTCILNTVGQVVIDRSSMSSGANVQLDVSTLPDGIYILIIQIGANKTQTPIIVSH